MQKLMQALLGGQDVWTFLGYVAWALIGAFIMVQIHANSRDPKSQRTPVKFSWAFWLRDNGRRALFSLVLIMVAIRFSPEIFGKEINHFWALIIGLSSDGLALLINGFKIANLTGYKKEGP
jgi:hypothetical protein